MVDNIEKKANKLQISQQKRAEALKLNLLRRKKSQSNEKIYDTNDKIIKKGEQNAPLKFLRNYVYGQIPIFK